MDNNCTVCPLKITESKYSCVKITHFKITQMCS